MPMSNAELEVALKAALQRLVTALVNNVAPDSHLLEGKSLAEITTLILEGTSANSLAVGGKSLSTIESERNAQLVAAIDALRLQLEGDIGSVTAASLGLGNVVNYGIATEEEALAGAADKYVTAMLAVKIAQTKIDAIVNAAPETLDTLREISEALHNNPDIIDNLMSSIGVNATAIEALETAVGVFEAKVMGYFDVSGNANNANLLAGKTLDEVLVMARDGVDMSNVVLKTDDLGAHPVALEFDTVLQEVNILVEVDGPQDAAARITRIGGVVAFYTNNGDSFVQATEEEVGSDWVIVQEAIDAKVGDFDQYYQIGWVSKEVTGVARTLKSHFENLINADKNLDAKVNTEIAGVRASLNNWTESIQSNINRIDEFAIETREQTFENQQAILTKIAVGGNLDTNVVTVGAGEEATEVALAQVIADIKQAIAAGGTATTEALQTLQVALDAFIASKATDEEAISGRDDTKYITSLALKAALDALDLSGKLDVDATAVDSNRLGGKTLEEVLDLIIKGSGGALAIKIDITENWAAGSNITLSNINFYDSIGGLIGHGVDLSGVTAVADSNIYFNNGVVELSDLNSGQSITLTGFGNVPKEVTHVSLRLNQLYDAKGTISVVNPEDVYQVYGSAPFDATLGQVDIDPSADDFTVPFDMSLVSGLSLIELDGGLKALKERVTAVETDKLDKTATAVNSELLEGRSIAGLTASGVEATAGVVTDKFMTPGTAKQAFDARWAEKVGAAPETLDTIEEIAAALRNNPDSLAAVETVAKQYTDQEVLAAIEQISGVDMEAGTTLASLYNQVVALQSSKLDAAATAVNSAKLGGKSLMEVIDAAVQPGRLFYPVVHVNGSLDDESYVMPSPADVWAQAKTYSVMEQVDTIYAIGVKRLLPGNLLALTGQEGMTLRGAVSEAQEGPQYVVMRASVDATEWEVITEPVLGCLARLSKHCVIVGDNVERFVPGQTMFYNGFEALSDNVYYDWTLLADKEWEVAVYTGVELVIDSARYHRSEIRIQTTSPVNIWFEVDIDLPYEMEVRFVNQTGVPVTFVGSNVVSVPRMEQYRMTKVNGVVRAVRYTNTAVAVAGDLDEAFFANPDYAPVVN